MSIYTQEELDKMDRRSRETLEYMGYSPGGGYDRLDGQAKKKKAAEGPVIGELNEISAELIQVGKTIEALTDLRDQLRRKNIDLRIRVEQLKDRMRTGGSDK